MELRGIIVPLVTPLTEGGALDEPSLERLIEHVIGGGVHGLFVLGTTGEAPGLPYALRRRLIEAAVRITRGRVPVLVGITDTAVAESVALAEHAASVGADAVTVAPPYYLPPGQPELRHYFEQLVPRLPLPCVLYNMPPLTKVSIGVPVLEALRARDGIVAVKDSSGDFSYFKTLRHVAHTGQEGRAPWRVLMGPELLMMDAVLAGGDGGVCGGANLYPRFFVRAYEAAARGDVATTRELEAKMLQIRRLYAVGQHASAIIKGLKAALASMALCGPDLAPPFERFLPPERAVVEALLEELDAIVRE